MGFGVGVLKECAPGERRVATVPKALDMVKKTGADVWIEFGAGESAGFSDAEYEAKGARLASADEVRQNAQVLLQVRVGNTHGLGSSHTVIGFCDPLGDPQQAAQFAATGAGLISMELIPRITRAQSMDALSSMASIAGYKAVILAAEALPRMFPMLMTAAGTIPATRVLVLGAGVAGLQAIATARRLGAVVMGYDVRSSVKEQIESLGAKFLNIELGTSGEGEGGYAKALGDDVIRRQRELMAAALREQDVVITTAAVPGRKAPTLITKEMARGMAPGSVIVDIAAERGGNCELTRAGETVIDNGVQILGPVNLPSTVPYHASMMYARNVATLLKHLTRDSQFYLDLNDEITKETLVARGGKVVHPKVQALISPVVNA